jgi:hypothetical protein
MDYEREREIFQATEMKALRNIAECRRTDHKRNDENGGKLNALNCVNKS